METLWWQVFIWLSLILISSLISIRLGISVAIIELIVGSIAGNIFELPLTLWVNFLAGFGAVVLTFLAGAELESAVLKKYWKESLIFGFLSFLAPFLLAWLVAQYILGWSTPEAQIAGIALSTTSVAVVYAVMVDTGLNERPLGKIILAACFITDLGTVIALGLLFADLGLVFWTFVAVTLVALFVLPSFTRGYFEYVKYYTGEPQIKFIFLVLAFLGFLATRAGSEAILPAYLVGAVLANLFISDKTLILKIRTIAVAILTPFFFIKAGSLVDIKAVYSEFGLVVIFFFAKTIAKFIGLYPAGVFFSFISKVNVYNVLLMSTGLTFGTVSALYGYTNGIITKSQYSILVVAVISTAIIPTIIAQTFFYPNKHEAIHFRKEEN